MKTYEQMAKDVLHRRDEALAEQAKRNSRIRRISLAASVCIVTLGVTAGVLGGIFLNRSDDPSSKNDPVLEVNTNTQENTTTPSENTTNPPENETSAPSIEQNENFLEVTTTSPENTPPNNPPESETTAPPINQGDQFLEATTTPPANTPPNNPPESETTVPPINQGDQFLEATTTPPANTPPEDDFIPPTITLETPVNGVFWNDLRERNENQYMSTENWIEWGWEELTDAERYTEMEFDGKTYAMMGTIKNHLGEWLASGEAYGYDFNEGNARHSIPCEIYALTFSPTHHVVAVQFTGQSEVYRFEWKKPYDPPATFGELLSDYNLPLSEMISLTSPGYQTAGTSWPSKYALSDADSDAIWEILKECENAPLNSNYNYRYNARTDISFSITSEILGIQGRPFVVNQDGYILANLEQYAYKFYIGADTAQEIIDYVLTHMTGPVPSAQPYEIVGVVTEIGDGYIKVDDSIMMKDPSEGLVFTITTEKKQLSRVVEHLLRVGSHVAVSYDGRVNEENPLLVETATNIQVVEIDTEGGGYIILE